MIEAKLIAVTQPMGDCPASGPEDLIGYCARVSSDKPKEERADNYEGLLKYCIRNKHWSIFEMASAVVEVRAPRDISRQLLRHRSFSFQEFSQRYSDDIEFCEREVRLQDTTNRQNSIETDDRGVHRIWDGDVAYYTRQSEEIYKWWRSHKSAAKECARVFLPEGLTMSTLYVNGTIRSWLHYLEVREGNGTQKEHVLLAREIRKCLEPVFPTIIGLRENE